MTRDEALQFLRDHQPMPSTAHLSNEDAQSYDEVREYFIEHPDPECIPLFLNSFGEGDAFGVYQLVDNVLTKYSHQQVVPHLISSLRSPHQSVRYWSAQMALNFSDVELIEPLSDLLSEDNSEVRFFAISALSFIESMEVDVTLKRLLAREQDDDIIELIQEALLDRRDRAHKQSTRNSILDM